MPSAQLPTIGIVVASTRTTRFADYPMEWILGRLRERTDLSIEVVDLREHPLPFYDLPTPPAMAGRVYTSVEERALGALLDAADGYLVITNEFNHGYSAALKNVIDHFFVEFRRKAIAFVGYGNVGGSRAIEQLRQVSAELEMVSTRHAVHIMGTQMREIRQDETARTEIFSSLDDRLDQVVGDLLWWTNALRAARGNDPV